MSSGPRTAGLTLRQAALIAGFSYLLNPVTYAEFALYPKLVIAGQPAQTVANIAAHHGAFLTMFLCYFVNFTEDIVIAWALYVLFAPVNRALSLLASIFQLVYAAICFVGLFNLAEVYRMLTVPEYLAAFGQTQLTAQVDLLIHGFRVDYSLGLLLFAIHLILVGALIYRSWYAPKWLGIVLAIDGLGWIVQELQPYFYPSTNLDWLVVTALGEVIFMLWLLIAGWRIPEP